MGLVKINKYMRVSPALSCTEVSNTLLCSNNNISAISIQLRLFLVGLPLPPTQLEWVNAHHDQYLFPVVSGFRIMSILNQCFSRLPPQFFSPGRAWFPLLKERKSLQIRLNKWFLEKPSSILLHWPNWESLTVQTGHLRRECASNLVCNSCLSCTDQQC